MKRHPLQSQKLFKIGAAKLLVLVTAMNLSAAPPANDAFNAAVELGGPEAAATGNNSEATMNDNNEPFSRRDNVNKKTVWWKWTAPSNGTVFLSTKGTNFKGQMLGLYVGSSAQNLKTVDDTETYSGFTTMRVTVAQGVTYYICVGSDTLESGEIKLSLLLTPEFAGAVSPLAQGSDTKDTTFSLNDKFADAIVLSGSSVSAIGYNRDATADELDEPFVRNSQKNHRSVWWRWTAPTSGTVRISLQGTASTYQELGLYVGSRTSNLKTVAFSSSGVVVDFASLSAPVVAGVVYYICVGADPSHSGFGGAIRLTMDVGADLSGALSPLSPSSDVSDADFSLNDRFENAVVLQGRQALAVGYHTEATINDIGEPFLGASGGGRTLWWRWTAPATGSVRLSMAGTYFNYQLLGMFTGPNAGNLVSAINEPYVYELSGPAQLTAKVRAGTTYHICAGNTSYSTQGNSVLRLSMGGDSARPAAPFAGASGFYQGVLDAPEGTGVLGLQLSADGKFTGSLAIGTRKIPLRGILIPGQNLSLNLPGLPELRLSFGGLGTLFSATMLRPGQQATQSLVPGYGGNGQEDLAPLAGRRINALAVPPSGGGIGYLTGIIGANGAVRFSGLSPEGTPFTASVRANRGDDPATQARIPVSLAFGEKSSPQIISGVLTLDSNALAGDLDWRKGNAKSATLAVEGNVWVPRVKTQNILDASSANRTFSLELATGAQPLKIQGASSPGQAPTLPESSALKFDAKTGGFRGTYKATDERLWQCKGVLVGSPLEDEQGVVLYGGGCIRSPGFPTGSLRILQSGPSE